MLVHTSPQRRKFNQYEELMLEIRRGGGTSECANLPLLMGQSDPRGYSPYPTLDGN
jgi:hypothetical protein